LQKGENRDRKWKERERECVRSKNEDEAEGTKGSEKRK
jgi:hypothetical protein